MTWLLERGFSLVESIVASLLVGIAIVTLAHLVTLGTVQASSSRQSTYALTLAQAKLEELRAQAWRFSPEGERISSGDLSISPPSSLVEDSDGYADALDRFGATVAPPEVPHYRRRWSISAFDAADSDTLLLHVCTFVRGRDAPGSIADACVWTVRTRKP